MDRGLSYTPSCWALALHQLPRYNLHLKPVDSLFAPRHGDYRQTFLFLAGVAALGLFLNLLSVLVDIACHCRRNRGEGEPPRREHCCPLWACVTAVAVCCTGVGIGFYGNSEMKDGMGRAVHALLMINHTLATMETLVSTSSVNVSRVVREDLTMLEEIFSERPEFLLPIRNIRRQAESLVLRLHGLVFWRGLDLELLELAEWGDSIERVRWPSCLALLLFDALLCLGTLPALARLARCPLIWLTILAVLGLVLSWFSLAVDFAASLALTDLCVQPEVYVLNTSHWQQVLDSDVLEYYLKCEQATPSPFGQALALSQRAASDAHQQLRSLLRGSASNLPSAQPRLLAVLETIETTEGNIHHLIARLHCHGLHKDLQDVWVGLCSDGLEGSLTLSLASLLTLLSLSSLAACLPRARHQDLSTQTTSREEREEEEEDDEPGMPPWSYLPCHQGRPRLHTFSSYSRPVLRPAGLALHGMRLAHPL